MDDLYIIALTSVPMKVFERQRLKHLKPIVVLLLHPLHLTYTANRNGEDTILVLLQRLCPHLEHYGSSACVMFF